MALRAFIGSTELELPSNFTIPSETHSPIFDFQELRLGDFQMGIEFPATPQNRIAFGFADELHQAEKVIGYDYFRIEEDGALRLQGVLVLKESTLFVIDYCAIIVWWERQISSKF